MSPAISPDAPIRRVITFRQLTALDARPAHWVWLGHALHRASRPREAVDAFKQGVYLHSKAGFPARARTVAKLILAIDPTNPMAERFAA